MLDRDVALRAASILDHDPREPMPGSLEFIDRQPDFSEAAGEGLNARSQDPVELSLEWRKRLALLRKIAH